MTWFRFEALDERGMKRSGRVEADSRARATALAGAGGLRVLKVEPVAHKDSIWQRDLFGTGGVKRGELLAFVKDLATLLGAELTVDRALRLAIRQSPKALRPTLDKVLADVLSGISLSRALPAIPRSSRARSWR